MPHCGPDWEKPRESSHCSQLFLDPEPYFPTFFQPFRKNSQQKRRVISVSEFSLSLSFFLSIGEGRSPVAVKSSRTIYISITATPGPGSSPGKARSLHLHNARHSKPISPLLLSPVGGGGSEPRHQDGKLTRLLYFPFSLRRSIHASNAPRSHFPPPRAPGAPGGPGDPSPTSSDHSPTPRSPHISPLRPQRPPPASPWLQVWLLQTSLRISPLLSLSSLRDRFAASSRLTASGGGGGGGDRGGKEKSPFFSFFLPPLLTRGDVM